MASHVAHHFVPVFLLEAWHGQDDGKLSTFRWANGRLVHKRRAAKNVAKEDHLYSFEGSGGSPDTSIERTFMGPHVDDPAAVAHKALLNLGLGSLTEHQQYEWARFLASLRVRVPAVVSRLRVLGREALVESLMANPQEYDAIKGDSPHNTLLDYFEAHESRLLNDFGTRILPDLIQSEQLMSRFITNRVWTIRSFPTTRYDLLLGDDPLIFVGAIENDHSFLLPMSPRKLFVVSSSEQEAARLRSIPDSVFVRDLNEHTAARAHWSVHSTGVAQTSFVTKYLRDSDQLRIEATISAAQRALKPS